MWEGERYKWRTSNTIYLCRKFTDVCFRVFISSRTVSLSVTNSFRLRYFISVILFCLSLFLFTCLLDSNRITSFISRNFILIDYRSLLLVSYSEGNFLFDFSFFLPTSQGCK